MPAPAVTDTWNGILHQLFWAVFYIGFLSIESHVRGLIANARREPGLNIWNDAAPHSYFRVFRDYSGGYILALVPEALTYFLYFSSVETVLEAVLVIMKATVLKKNVKLFATFNSIYSSEYRELIVYLVAVVLFIYTRYFGGFRRIGERREHAN
jgi:hypothetical protein